MRRAGLSPKATNRDMRRLLEYNGYRVPRRVGVGGGGLMERQELLNVLEQIVPPMTESEQADLLVDADPMVLQEHEWKFTLASELNKILAGALGIVNLGGAAYLGTLFTQLDMAAAAGNTLVLPGWISIVKGFYPALLGYAILYNMIPLVRKFWLDRQNIQIRK